MKERPLIRNADQLHAIFNGATQMRFPIKGKDGVFLDQFFGAGNAPADEQSEYTQSLLTDEGGVRVWLTEYPEEGSELLKCPYGQPGDRLWVREEYSASTSHSCTPEDCCDCDDGVLTYFADMQEKWFGELNVPSDWSYDADGKAIPPSKMERWASRITLEIVNVRVERLQDISQVDARAEGCGRTGLAEIVFKARGGPAPTPLFGGSPWTPAQEEYKNLWNKINGPGAWEKNPWVWVIEFRKLS